MGNVEKFQWNDTENICLVDAQFLSAYLQAFFIVNNAWEQSPLIFQQKMKFPNDDYSI